VSLRPKPSVPSTWNGPGTQRAIWSGTAFMKSDTATNGPSPPLRISVTRGVRGFSPGCSRFQRSVVSASSRSALYDVADHRSTATSWCSASSRCASSAASQEVPENRMLARFALPAGASAKR
jgi:hypothetical protein